MLILHSLMVSELLRQAICVKRSLGYTNYMMRALLISPSAGIQPSIPARYVGKRV